MSGVERNMFYAHSAKEGADERLDKRGWQLLAHHLFNVGELAAHKASYFGGEGLARIEGVLHDLGKYTEAFQQRLEGSPKRVDHATHGARMVYERFGNLGLLMAYAIAGHHAGLANGRDNGELTCLKERLEKELPKLWPGWEDEIELQATLAPPGMKPVGDRGCFQLAFLGRMLFSCLVDADFLDTERFYMRAEQGIDGRDQRFPPLAQLRDQLRAYMNKLSADSQDTDVNRIRADIRREVCDNAGLEPGLFSLNVPTGGGKTLSSLAFALDHAIAHGLRRVIFVIPFTSIVEQNAKVFRRALGRYGNEAVVEHHSAFDGAVARGGENGSKDKLRLAAENWQAPIVVTTSVQFFESLYANKASRCRKLHNIAGSVVILDEAQALPVKLLMPCVTAMDELALNYRTSLVLCTATQPALAKADDFENGLENVRPLIAHPDQLHQQLERVRVEHVGALSDDELVEKLAQHEQVLCIVNSRRHARSLYQAISDWPGARHLTTLMCARHRSHALEEIRVLLEAGEPCRLIATSLIEAGVDVDFPAVYRVEAGLDAIAQAAGRCNREGKRPTGDSHVVVFTTADDWPTPPDLEQFAGAARSVFRRHRDPMLPEAVTDYFKELYWIKGRAQMGGDMLKRIEAAQIGGIPYEDLARDFRMIDNPMQPVIVPFDDNVETLLQDLAWVETCGRIARKLQPYLVQVPERSLKALKDSGAVQPVEPERFGEQFMKLANSDLYHEEYGLDWDEPAFISAERLVT